MINSKRISGFTLLELLIAVAIAGFLLLGITRLYKSTVWSYSLQTQESEMNQNAYYSIKRLSEVIGDAGGLPARVNAIKSSGPTEVIITTNPKNGSQVIQSTVSPGTDSIQVTSDSGFLYADSLLHVADSSTTTFSTAKIDSIHMSTSRVYFHPSMMFAEYDTIYAFSTHSFFLNATNLTLCEDTSTNALAENIETLSIIFYLADGVTATTTWSNMKSATILVTARTSIPDPSYKGSADGYRRLTMNESIRLRDKI